MKLTTLSLMIVLAAPASAQCGWSNDGDMANALAESNWQITAKRGIRVEKAVKPGTAQVSLVAELPETVLSVGQVLRGATLNDTKVALTLVGPEQATTGTIKAGRTTVNIQFPEIETTPCGSSELSAILISSDIDRPMGARLMLRATQTDRFIGLLQVSGATGLYSVGAALYSVEATLLP